MSGTYITWSQALGQKPHQLTGQHPPFGIPLSLPCPTTERQQSQASSQQPCCAVPAPTVWLQPPLSPAAEIPNSTRSRTCFVLPKDGAWGSDSHCLWHQQNTMATNKEAQALCNSDDSIFTALRRERRRRGKDGRKQNGFFPTSFQVSRTFYIIWPTSRTLHIH